MSMKDLGTGGGGFFDFLNDIKYQPHERNFALGILTVIGLSGYLLYCALKIDADEKRYIETLKARARKRGLHVE